MRRSKMLILLFWITGLVSIASTVHAAAVDVLSITDALSGSAQTYTVPVDSTMSQLKLTISGASSIVVTRPDSSIVSATDLGVQIGTTAAGVIYVIDSPAIGDWLITVNGSAALTLSVSGQASLHFLSFHFVRTGGCPGHKGFFNYPGDPVVGPSNIAQAVLSPDYRTADFQFRSPTGAVLGTLPLILLDPTQNDFFGLVDPPTTPFLVYVVGMDLNGEPYQRVMPGAMKAQTVFVNPPFPTDLIPGTTINLVFEAMNFGPPDSFNFTAEDEKGFVVSVTPLTSPFATGETKDVVVQLAVPLSATSGTSDKVTLSAQSTTDVGQKNSASVTSAIFAVTFVTVPNVVGLDLAAAEAAIAGADLLVGTLSVASSASVLAGSVISQDPLAASSVVIDSTVALVLSSGPAGPAPVIVPNVVGQTQTAAMSAITAAGLVVGTISTQSSGTVPAGVVILQNPTAGSSVAAGSAVNLVVSSGPALVIVPNVVGQTQAAAQAVIMGAGLTIGTITTATSPTIPAGNVSSQTPTAGTSVVAGSAVALVVSSGAPPVSVPNVVGLTQTAAQAALSGVGLVVGTVNTVNSSTIPAGAVISQSPTAGTSVPAGSVVNIVLSLGPALVTVPNVVGQGQASAQAAITAAGLTIGTISTASSGTVPIGVVISQSPSPGTTVAPGGAVNLVISSGPMLVTVPNVVALTQASAEATITTASLVVGTVTTATNNTVPAGSVISQSPTGGSNVPAGSAVNLVVSSGPAPVTVCDVDGNGVINQNDINAIFAARGRTATGPNDPRDANKDGLITTADSRLCVLQCTKPQCAP